MFVPGSIEGIAAASCIESAKNAMSIIFDPLLWWKAFKEFPSKGGKRKWSHIKLVAMCYYASFSVTVDDIPNNIAMFTFAFDQHIS